MVKMTTRKERSDKGTRRNGRADDVRYAFRLSPDNEKEASIIKAIADHLHLNPNDSLRTIIVDCVGDRVGVGLTREEAMHETFEKQIERLAATIDQLLSSGLQRGVVGYAPAQEDQSTNGVNMDYLKRIQQTLRGGKK